ncbi:TetR/AcrR family transcriptional regulator [Actinoallomurus iriomotensis]|uniref:TetR family transcriptional regulator n=1 Tax=Actinoallomurus iriomotensis TaxID=478107 RepID=A0A9W6SCE2_9ACTN|nr:TetR/AcrR family transcriptional regulator [Actinoallomurus iriomotensis]GLY91309.1 TetR family transcriptional regulator [Actinoallomurus iriomotensis]
MPQPTAPPGRSAAKHEAILRAATEVFLRDGYARASVDAIAATAGVGKQTVYGHFGDKERLFLAVVAKARKATGVDPEDLGTLVPDTGDARADLQSAGERLLRAILAPENMALHRLTIAELTHHPELQRSWRDDGNSQAISDAIATYLAERDRRGDLAVPDPPLAARQFIMLLSAEGQVRSLRGVQTLAEDEIREIARQTTDLIVRAHRPS